MINETWTLAVSLAVICAILFVVLVRGTLRQTKWGINLKATYCPRCGEKIPFAGKPTSLHQFLWGGWTCPKCGCEVGKWGIEVDELKEKESR